MTSTPATTTATAAAAPPAGPRTLHPICELTRLAACGYCPAAGLDWPCTSSETGPEGYHVARFAAAMRRGLITGADFAVVRRDGRGVHQRHARLRRPAGRCPMTAAVPGPAAPDALAAALAPDLVAIIGYLTAPDPDTGPARRERCGRAGARGGQGPAVRRAGRHRDGADRARRSV